MEIVSAIQSLRMIHGGGGCGGGARGFGQRLLTGAGQQFVPLQRAGANYFS